MRIPRLYTTQFLAEGASVSLEAEAIHYIVNVLRVKAGRSIILFNGLGGEYHGVVQVVGKKQVTVELHTYASGVPESPLTLKLGVCLIKYDRMDWLLQKAVELGVTHISPLISTYTDIKLPEEKRVKKNHHWQQVIVNACQQSGRVSLPELTPLMALPQWVTTVDAQCKYLLHPHRTSPLDHNEGMHSAALLVGPEGGLTEEEVTLALQHQFNGVALGPRILRAETAPLAALSILQHRFGDV